VKRVEDVNLENIEARIRDVEVNSDRKCA
jgi:hypothetical protein